MFHLYLLHVSKHISTNRKIKKKYLGLSFICLYIIYYLLFISNLFIFITYVKIHIKNNNK